MQRKGKTKINPLAGIFKFLQTKKKVEIWLYENNEFRMEGYIIGFDEYMNMVLDNASEVTVRTKNTRQVGRILLKGENISLVRGVEEQQQ